MGNFFMSENKLIVKDDINFLEYPNWLLDEKDKVKEYIIKKENGTYKLSTASDTLPTRFDKIVLYYLLHELFKTTKLNSTKIITTRYKVAKNIFSPPPDVIQKKLKKIRNVGKNEYSRIMLALKRWTDVSIEFEGIFYEGDNYTTRFFHIIDSVKLDHKTKELYIAFNEQYIKQLRETEFYKYINFNEYKKLTKPISVRLYEILIKTFKGRDTWQIDIINLAEKLTLSIKYPAHIFAKLTPAVKEITSKTDLKIKFKYDKESRICTFIKNEEVKPINDSTKRTILKQQALDCYRKCYGNCAASWKESKEKQNSCYWCTKYDTLRKEQCQE